MTAQNFYEKFSALTLLSGLLLIAGCAGSGGSVPGAHAQQSAAKNANAFMQSITPPTLMPNSVPIPPMQQAAQKTMSSRTPQSAIVPLSFTQIPGAASQVAASPDGSSWVLGTSGPANGDQAIFHLVSGVFVNVPGAARRIAVGPDGTPWVINSAGGIYHLVNGVFTGIGGAATELSVGGTASAPLVDVISNQTPGPYGAGIYQYNVNAATWTQLPGAGVTVAASIDSGTYSSLNINPGGFYVTNANGGIYYYNPGIGFEQLPGGAVSLAPTASGGLFALGNPGASQHGIYYNDFNTGTWTQQPGAAVALSASASSVYAVGAGGGIYVSPLTTDQTVTTVGSFRVAGIPAVGAYAALDGIINAYMTANNARAAELAVVRGGQVLFSHAYTNSSDPNYPTTRTTSIMRLASNSKPFAIVAANSLVSSGRLNASAAVFPLLGITSPLLASQVPDPRINTITVQELIDFTSGLHGEEAGDPTFMMRSIENQAGDTAPLTKSQYTRYLYGFPLDATPGSTPPNTPSNADPYLLGRVIEVASGQQYMNYLNSAILNPLGITDAIASSTSPASRPANEVSYDDDPAGPSLTVLDPTSSALLPCPDGGATLFGEVDDSSSGLAISAASWAKFIQSKFFEPGSTGSYTGSMCGTASYVEPLPNNMVWAIIFNKRTETFSPSSALVTQIESVLKPL